jgi:nucleoid-associated protein YgaU
MMGAVRRRESAATRDYVVGEGDTLSRISLQFYGTALRWREIFEANRDQLETTNSLRPGQRLRIP